MRFLPNSAKWMHWAKSDIRAVAEQLSPSVGIPVPVLEVALKRQSYGIKPIDESRDRGAAEHCGHLLRAWTCCPRRSRFPTRCGRVHDRFGRLNANLLWFLPTHGDGRYLGTSIGGRQVDFSYLRQVAQAADDLGYFGVLLPTGRSCDDSWVVASAVAPFTKRLRYLVAVRPGLQSPSVAARMTATLDRITGGRLLINVVTGGDPVENKGDGIFPRMTSATRSRASSSMSTRRCWRARRSTSRASTLPIEDGRLLFAPVQKPRPAALLRRVVGRRHRCR